MDKIQTRKPNDRSSYKTKAKSSTDKKQKNKTKKQECRAMSGVTMFLEFSSYNWDWKHFLWDEEIKPSSWVETGVALRPAFMGGAWKKLLLPAALEQGGGLGWLTSTSGKKKKKKPNLICNVYSPWHQHSQGGWFQMTSAMSLKQKWKHPDMQCFHHTDTRAVCNHRARARVIRSKIMRNC